MTLPAAWSWIILAVVIAATIGWILRRMWREMQAERARELFRLQHERFEKHFFERAAASGVPRGLRWINCVFSNEMEFVRERATRQIAVLVGVTVEFAAIEGGDMEGLPAVPLPRHGSAVLLFERGEWTSAGRVIFNLAPREVVERFAIDYEPLSHSHPAR
ncbi:MAG: hypothetical protein K8T89_23345 [Planctomycetes bacterium]|nr:hypothetical protein [Planctomycetota bacterium]